MNQPYSRPTEQALPEDAADRCLLYLFGELDDQQAMQFEQALETDAALREYFHQQASTIALLSKPVAPAMPVDSVRRQPVSRPSARWAWLALAAGVLLAVGFYALSDPAEPTVTSTPNDATQQLAQAWVVAYGAAEQADEAALADETEPKDVAAWEELNAPPNWLVVAVSGIEAEASTQQETADG